MHFISFSSFPFENYLTAPSLTVSKPPFPLVSPKCRCSLWSVSPLAPTLRPRLTQAQPLRGLTPWVRTSNLSLLESILQPQDNSSCCCGPRGLGVPETPQPGSKIDLAVFSPTYPQTPTFKPRREKMLRHLPVTYISIGGDLRCAMTFHLTSCVGSSPATPLELSCLRKQKPLWLAHRLRFCSCQSLLMRLTLFRLAVFMLPEISACHHFLYEGLQGPHLAGFGIPLWIPLSPGVRV